MDLPKAFTGCMVMKLDDLGNPSEENPPLHPSEEGKSFIFSFSGIEELTPMLPGGEIYQLKIKGKLNSLNPG